MKALFLGLFFDEEGLQQSYKEVKGGVQIAPHRFQTLLIEGLEENGVEVSCIHAFPCGTFPIHHRRLVIRDKRWGRSNYRIGCLNLPWFKQRTHTKKAYAQLKQALSGDNPPSTIFVYYVHLPFWKGLQKIKKQFPWVKIVCLMTEAIPGRGDIVDTNRRKRLGDKMVEMAKIADAFALITPHLKEPLEVGERPYIVLDAIADEKTPLARDIGRQERTFLYTGGVYEQFDVHTLIDAFAYLPDCTLWLCGRQEGMEERLKNSPNVQYFGEVPFEELQSYREKCSYLINPRRPTGTYTKYSFPSKTIEYLSSGKPMVGYLLEGMGEEYYPYLNPLYGKDAKSLAEDLQRLVDSDYSFLTKRALEGRQFVLTQKTSIAQANKLIEFIKKI